MKFDPGLLSQCRIAAAVTSMYLWQVFSIDVSHGHRSFSHRDSISSPNSSTARKRKIPTIQDFHIIKPISKVCSLE